MPQVLVYGFYGKGNIGDELFREAFTKLFPWLSFRFVSKIDTKDLEGVDAVFFGGGSFMYMPPWVTPAAMPLLLKKTIFYAGVGVEQVIDPVHQVLLSHAAGVFIRSQESLEIVQRFNAHAQFCPDIVFALDNDAELGLTQPGSILIIPNVETVPKHTSPHWAHVAWEHFKDEFAQAIDVLIEGGHTVHFLPFCKNKTMDDTWPASEIVARMTRRSPSLILPVATEKDVILTMSSYDTVITQRYHGIVLAQLARRPCLVVHHHDKLKYAPSVSSVSFYEASKNTLLSELSRIQGSYVAPPKIEMFDELVAKVTSKLMV